MVGTAVLLSIQTLRCIIVSERVHFQGDQGGQKGKPRTFLRKVGVGLGEVIKGKIVGYTGLVCA